MPTATLKPVKRAAKGHNRFCGPAALSIIAGIDTAEASAVIRHVTGKRSVTGTTNWAILKSLSLLGFRSTSAAKVNPLDPKSNPTLAAWLKSDERDGQSLYLISAGHHWQVVQGRRFCCGVSKDIVSIRDGKVKRRARVAGVWRIEHDSKVALADVLPVKVRVKDAEATVRRKAHALARAHGIHIETYRADGYTQIIVWGPHWSADVVEDDADPYYGDHYADNWADALGRVEEYVQLIAAKPELVA